MRFLVLHAAIAALFPLAALAQQVTLPTGATITGALTTNDAGDRVQVFKGIPYAAEPPVGEKRWKPSTLALPLSNDFNATAFGNVCLSNPLMDGDSTGSLHSEDCLYLNVYTPVGANASSNFPVMVWTYGGGFIGGASDLYDGSNLIGAANNEMVYVSFNYRLGIMGFLSNEQLSKEGVSGNLGLRDQEVAYEWIKQNIHHFGGNPDAVTAFGESAGAMSIALHLVARDGKQNHFKKAIMESGSYPSFYDMLSPTECAAFSTTLAQGTGCANDENLMDCLRAVNGSKIMEAAGLLNWRPSVDGEFLREAPVLLVQRGEFSRIPTIMGTNVDEGWIFVGAVANEGDFTPYVTAQLNELTAGELEQVETLYPVDAFATPRLRASRLFTDLMFVCPSERFSNALAETGAPTFRYRFAKQLPGVSLVVHGSEIAYVFNLSSNFFSLLGPITPDVDLTTSIQEYWVNFAKTGSPNGHQSISSSPKWPSYDAVAKQQILLQTNVTVETSGAYVPTHTERCAFWDAANERVAMTELGEAM